MKSKESILICLLSLALFSCKKDTPPDDTVPAEENIVVLSEGVINTEVYMSDGPSLFIKMPDGTYTIAYTAAEDGIPYVGNFSENGTPNWIKATGISDDRVTAIELLNGNEYVVCINNAQNAVSKIMKLNTQGDSLWSFYHSYNQYEIDVVELPDNNILCAKVVNKRGNLLKLSPNGDSLASYYITDTMPKFASTNYMVHTADAGIITIYNYNDSSSNHFMCLTKTDFNGTIIWQKTHVDYYLCDLNLLPDGSLLGVSYNWDPKIVKFSSGGDIVFFFGHNQTSQRGAVVELADGNYLLCSNFIVTKFSSTGSVIWTKTYYADFMQSEIQCVELIVNTDNTFTVLGYRGSMSIIKPVILRFRIGS